MANKRTGLFGTYYGSFLTESETLTASEQKANATYIYKSLIAKGWNINSVSALLGNMQAESGLNPGRWQSDDVNNTSMGYGLVQWTPSTKYTLWATESGYLDPSEMDTNIARITYELKNNIQWIATSNYDYSFETFATGTGKTVSELAKAFLLNYERPADQSASVQAYRASLAESWYTYLTGVDVDPSEPEGGTTAKKTKKKKFNFILFNKRRRKQWGATNF